MTDEKVVSLGAHRWKALARECDERIYELLQHPDVSDDMRAAVLKELARKDRDGDN